MPQRRWCTLRAEESAVRAHDSQRGAAAAEGSRRDKCVRSKLGAVSRRAERGDFVAHRGRCEWDHGTNISKPKVSNHALICDFSADRSILYSKGRAVVTALLAARKTDTDKLSTLAA